MYNDTETMLLLTDLHPMNKSVTLCLLESVEGGGGSELIKQSVHHASPLTN